MDAKGEALNLFFPVLKKQKAWKQVQYLTRWVIYFSQLKRTSCCGGKVHLLLLAWQQPACFILWLHCCANIWSGLGQELRNYTSGNPDKFGHTFPFLFPSMSLQDQSPRSSGIKEKQLQSCWTKLSGSINVMLRTAVRYFSAEGSRAWTLIGGRKCILCAYLLNTSHCDVKILTFRPDLICTVFIQLIGFILNATYQMTKYHKYLNSSV